MADQNQKKQGEDKNGFNPVAAAIAGAVVGATAAVVAGAAVLANDDSRKNVEKAIDEVKGNMADMKAEVEENLAEGKERVTNTANSVKGSFDHGVKDAEKAARTK